MATPTFTLTAVWTILGAVLLLMFVTGCFMTYRNRYSRRVQLNTKADPSRRLTFHSTDETERLFLQAGYSSSFVGSTILTLWFVLMVAAYFTMVVLTGMSYYPEILAQLGTTYDQFTTPWLLAFAVFHLLAAIMIQFYSVMRTKFMLPEAFMADATHVLIEEAVAALDESQMADPGEASDESVPGFLQTFAKQWRSLLGHYRHAVLRTLLKIKSDGHGTREFEYTCVRYVFDEEASRFRPVGSSLRSSQKALSLLKEGGLTNEQAKESALVTGSNEIRVRVPGIFESLLIEFCDLIYVFQSIGAWTYMISSAWNIGVVWLLMSFISGAVRALLIVRKGQIKIAKLAKLTTRVKVLRSGGWLDIPASEIVLDDLVRVEEQQPLPCDGFIVGGGVIVNESMLTGEAMPLPKHPVEDTPQATVASRNMLYAGTHCMQSTGPYGGEALLFATGVGALTRKGQLVRMVLFPNSVRFKYNDQLPIIYGLMCLYAVLMTVLFISLTSMGSWVVTLIQVCSTVTQSLNPMLPVAMIMGQAVSAGRLERTHKIFCLQPGRIPVAGKISTMVFDKTGTITKGGMDFAAVIPVSSRRCFAQRVTFDRDLSAMDVTNQMKVAEQVPEVLQFGLAACHTVTVLRDGSLVGNHVEVAMVETTGWSLPHPADDETDFHAIIKSPQGTVPKSLEVVRLLDFDHVRMTSGVVVRNLQTGELLVLVKGSYERVAALSTPESLPSDYVDVAESCAADNYYTLAMGVRVLPESTTDEWIRGLGRDDLEAELQMCGLLLFRNEIKPDSASAILALKEGSVRSVMCTGDNALTGISVAKQCHILEGKGRVLLGSCSADASIDWTNPETGERGLEPEVGVDQLAVDQSAWRYLYSNRKVLDAHWKDLQVCARMKPEDKVNLTKYLQSKNLVVGMCGDGGNDCGALRAAHVGMALSDAEASMVSPFSSGAGGRSIWSVVQLLREGRACLTTNLATYSFFIIYAFVITGTRLSGTIVGNLNTGQFVWLTMDIYLSVLMVWTMTLSHPAKKLGPIRPTASLLGWRTIAACAVPIVLYYALQGAAFGVLWAEGNSSWYYHINTLDMSIPPQDWVKKADNYDAACQTLVLLTVLMTQAYTATYGGKFRRSVVRNIGINITYAVGLALVFGMLLSDPNDLNCVYRVNCDTSGSMAVSDVPILPVVAVGSIGDCFLGPQVHRYQLLGYENWTPEVSQNCMPPDAALEELPYDSPLVSALGYDGPNNVYSGSYKRDLSILLISYMVVVHLFVKLVLLGPIAKYFRKRQDL